ncbi:MAG: CatB-related O-acetyltransferase [Bacteroidaceae bacterium]|nr:CatB-related O-acetyltransferase [Bacteroidaceae bacterium]
MSIIGKLKQKLISKVTRQEILTSVPELKMIVWCQDMLRQTLDASWFIRNNSRRNKISGKARLYGPYHITDSKIGDYTYVSMNSYISMANIGKFCSIGPNFLCGWGIHPLNTVSTNPMFYSRAKQNGISLSRTNKIKEREAISIGNDVFIGANVTVLDGVTIGDGAVIGAGAVVSKDIPPYAVAVGCPIKIIKYRFDEDTRNRLIELKWWNWNYDRLKDVEKYFFDVDTFLNKSS